MFDTGDVSLGEHIPVELWCLNMQRQLRHNDFHLMCDIRDSLLLTATPKVTVVHLTSAFIQICPLILCIKNKNIWGRKIKGVDVLSVRVGPVYSSGL